MIASLDSVYYACIVLAPSQCKSGTV